MYDRKRSESERCRVDSGVKISTGLLPLASVKASEGAGRPTVSNSPYHHFVLAFSLAMSVEEVYTTRPPPKPTGVLLRIYSNPFCPFARVRLNGRSCTLIYIMCSPGFISIYHRLFTLTPPLPLIHFSPPSPLSPPSPCT